ncbi:hypothetical protein DM558_06440 [Entomomonas moraniae]|uniref:Uncharacterized protein n=1 Tax=Entomomonas moraniae TaxID=2213226 RepID=A0A3S9XDL2_9GAMM|nr:hypothetical protein [Entomomonas moraniae]AZS50436.1 hypothetical protein DM558_06440 [Entomomonas moraniae]
MGLILLAIFFIALIVSSVIAVILIIIVGKVIKPGPIKVVLFILGAIIMIGAISFYSISNIDSPGSSIHGFEQVKFYVILFASSPLIGAITSSIFFIFTKIFSSLKSPNW